jgi:hypothetical protein
MFRGRIAAEFDNGADADVSLKEKIGNAMQGLLP